LSRSALAYNQITTTKQNNW